MLRTKSFKDWYDCTNVKHCRQAKVDLVKLAETILNNAQSESRGLTAAEQTGYNVITADLATVRTDLVKVEAEMERQRAIESAASPYGTGRRGPTTDRSYRGMFGALKGSAFESGKEFLEAVHSGRHDPRLTPMAGMFEGHDSAGGFSCPEELSAQWLDSSLENEIVRPRATVWPMNAPTRKIPGFDGRDHTSALFGGLTATWLAEGGTAVDVDAKLLLLTLTAHKLAVFAKVSNELIQDGLGFEAQFSTAMSRACSWYLDYSFLRGTGAGEPRGVLVDPALVVVSKEGGQVADTILYENVCKMFARLHPACLGNSIWVANTTTIPKLLSLCQAVGTGGNVVPVMSQVDGKFSMLTRPVVFTEKLPVLGDQGDLILADFSQYGIGIRREISLDKSVHIGWQQDESGFRAILRCDGMGLWNRAITPKNGDPLSWAVTLQAR